MDNILYQILFWIFAFAAALAMLAIFLFVVHEFLGGIVGRLKEIVVLLLKTRDEAIRKRWHRIYGHKKRKNKTSR